MSSMWTIRRSATDSKLTGLCGGLARYWGIDPTLVRVGAAMLALSGGIGVVLYLAGWLLIPQDGKTQARADELFGPQVRRWSKEVWLAIVVIACVIAFAIFGAYDTLRSRPGDRSRRNLVLRLLQESQTDRCPARS